MIRTTAPAHAAKGLPKLVPTPILTDMAAKNKSKGRARKSSAGENPDIQEIFALHLEGTRRYDELLQQARTLQSAGKIREARRLLNEAEGIHRRLTALEDEFRRPAPKSDDH